MNQPGNEIIGQDRKFYLAVVGRWVTKEKIFPPVHTRLPLGKKSDTL